MPKRLFLIFILLSCCLMALALKDKDKKDAPSDAELAAITARGRALAEYDTAAWHASDAFTATNPAKEENLRYICRKGNTVWTCVFGRLNPDRDKFLISYEAVQQDRPTKFSVQQHQPPIEDTAFYLAAAKAIEIGMHDFTPEAAKRLYNAAVLPVESQLYVYFVPAQTKAGVYPLGGDVRYLFSEDGSNILEKRRLHQSVIDASPSNVPPGGKWAGGIHTHILSDVPEDTDVFYVLTRKPSGPEFIGTKKCLYEVQTDGTVKITKKN